MGLILNCDYKNYQFQTFVLLSDKMYVNVFLNLTQLIDEVNIADSWLNKAASILHYKVGNVPFLYLGLSIGGNPRKLAFWDLVLHTIKSRLSGWQSHFISFGGRLVLLKSVLTSLLVYALSFFKAPSGIISSIESMF